MISTNDQADSDVDLPVARCHRGIVHSEFRSQVVEEAVPALGFTPRVGFNGPLDTVVQPDLVADVRAVVREALTNTAKYAHASAVEVEITTDVANRAVTVGVPAG